VIDMSCILIVDDDYLNREMLRDVLEASGHQVVEASGGTDALRRYRPQQIDLVLSDVLMPGKTGLEFLGELRQINPDARVIVYGSTGETDLVRATNLGALRTFPKPFSTAGVIRAITHALAPTGTSRTSAQPLIQRGLRPDA
jgi:CheY-like chemotaxis protein